MDFLDDISLLLVSFDYNVSWKNYTPSNLKRLAFAITVKPLPFEKIAKIIK